MKPVIFVLLLLLMLSGCQKASSSASSPSSSEPMPSDADQAELARAQAIVAKLAAISTDQPPTVHDAKAVQEISDSFLAFDNRDSRAHGLLRKQGIPLLVTHFDRMLPLVDDFHIRLAIEEMLAVFSVFQTPETLDRFVQGSQKNLLIGSDTWTRYIWEFQPGSPKYEVFWGTMLANWPENEVVAQALLSAANDHAMDEEMREHQHPFRSPKGLERLRSCLLTTATIQDGYLLSSWEVNGENPSVESARLAAEALAFIESPQRDEMLKLAESHPVDAVQLEAAWVKARLGQQSGLDELVRRTRELPLSLTAQIYLEDLGRVDLIPAECFQDKFQIRAYCAQQLASTFIKPGKIESIEILDRRNLLWPLERMEVILVSYRIEFKDEDKSWTIEDVGHVSNSSFHASSNSIPIFSDKSPGDQLAGYSPDDIFGFLLITQLKRTFVATAKALTEEYAEAGATLEGPETLPEGDGKLVGRVLVNLQMFQFPKIEATIFETTNNGQPGWTVLDQGKATFFAQADLPETATARHLLRMVVGRKYLDLVEEK